MPHSTIAQLLSVKWLIVGLLAATLFPSYVNTSTHWVVTEDGKLHAQSDSMLHIRRPYDLAAFISQEQRLKTVEDLKADILAHQDIVESTDDKDDGFEERFLANEYSCMKAGKRLPDFDLYISTVLPLENKGIKAEEHLNLESALPLKLNVPHCTDHPLPFSMYAFEHLSGVQNRRQLDGMTELGLKSAITHKDNEDEYGHLVAEALKKNETSWVLYNMAAFYWRIKGNPYEAVECLRRAMHYSPLQYVDVAYVSLGNILHRAKYSKEAAIVLTAALDLSKALNVNHFTLGNIYAVLTEYNKSVEHFDITLAIQPDFEAAEKRRWAVICHSRLEQALEEQHRSLQDALEQLRSYQTKHERMHRLSEKLMSEQAGAAERIRTSVDFKSLLSARRQNKASVMGEHCELLANGDESSVSCRWKDTSIPPAQKAVIDESRFSNVPIQDEKMEQMKPIVASKTATESPRQDYSKPLRPPLYGNKNSTPIPEHANAAIGTDRGAVTIDVIVFRLQNDVLFTALHPFDKEKKPEKPVYQDENWPTREECDSFGVRPLEWNEYPTTFLPPENKGFDVFLAEAIDLQANEQHPLPWYPPICVNIVDLKQGDMFMDHLDSIKDRDKVPIRLADESMKKILLSWVNNGDVEEEEVGQRILTALKQNLAPRWLLYNLAGLYWRVVGNNYHGIECLRRSLHFVPADYLDVPLVNMANILYKWNKIDDALNLTKQALVFSPYEPVTHFTQANLLAAKQNETGAVYHYEQALSLDPDFKDALNMLRNLKCYTKFHKTAISNANKNICQAVRQESQCGGKLTDVPALPLCSDLSVPVNQNELSLEGFLRKSKLMDPLEADAMKEFHRASGLCSGTDCDHIVHRPGTEPYIKIKSIGPGSDAWIQRLLFSAPDEEIPVEDDECFLLKGGVRTSGCEEPEFKKNSKRLVQLEKVLAELYVYIDEQEKAGQLMVDDKEAFAARQKAKEAGEFIELDGFIDIVCVMEDEKDQIRCFSKKDASPDEIELPGLKKRTAVSEVELAEFERLSPTSEECRNYKEIDFHAFTSTWLSVGNTGVDYVDDQVSLTEDGNDIDFNVSDHVDFNEEIKEIEEPMCVANFGASAAMFDHLPSIANKEKLMYTGEEVLKEIILSLETKKETVEVIGTRIAHALNKNATSWTLGCLGALYWRAKGNAPNAINCLRMAIRHVAAENKHIPLLSLANILHKAGAIDDALEIATTALNSSPKTVVIHFSIGNMYAAKSDFGRAAAYYSSTLTLQEEFEPARERLLSIMCGGLLEEGDEEE